MAIITNVKTRGAVKTSTLSGNIVLDEANGELRISRVINGDNVVINKIDVLGSHYYDSNGVKRISTGIDPTTGRIREVFYDSNGKSRILIGQKPTSDDQIIAVAKPDTDVITELSS